jgi:hypothetical protein
MRHVESDARANEFFWLLKKGDFILHLPFWNSFSWEVNSFPELQNINESGKSLFSCPDLTKSEISAIESLYLRSA